MQQQNSLAVTTGLVSPANVDATLQQNRSSKREGYKQMEINVDSTINKDAVDEYFIPFEPDHALALTMNFPQFSESILPLTSAAPQPKFNYNCADCVADLFGPIMAPYAVLQQQSEDYRIRLEYIAYRRYMAMKSDLVQSFERDFKQKWKQTFRHPFRYDTTAFLSSKGTIERLATVIMGGCIVAIGIGLLCLAIFLILISDSWQPMLTFIRTFSKFYRTLVFQGVIGYFVSYSVLLIITGLCSLFGALLCSIPITIAGIIGIILAFALSAIMPLFLNIYQMSLILKLQDYMRVSIKDFDNIPENPLSTFWNDIQKRYACCGVDDAIRDYTDSYFEKLTNQHVPESCCRNGMSCTNAPTIINSHRDTPCLPAVTHFLELTFKIARIGHGIIAGFLLFTLFIIILLVLSLKLAIQALNEYNKFILQSMLSILEQYENELDPMKFSFHQTLDQSNLRQQQQRIRGILPITPTVIRVKSPRIMNYLGFG